MARTGLRKKKWIIRSFEGVGLVKIGMTRAEVRQKLNGEVQAFRKAPQSVALADHFVDHDAIAFYDIDDRLEAIEFSDSAILEWNAISLLGRPPKAILENVKKYSKKVEIDFDGVIFPDLGFGFWAPGWAEDETEMPQSVIVFKRDYYAK